jgi:hypothetical protein
MFHNGLSTTTSICSSMGRKHRTSGVSDKQKKPRAIYGDGPNFAWTNPEIDVLRNLTVEQHRLLSKNSRDRKRSKQLCTIDGLQHRTFNAVYSKVCKLRPVSQRTKRWTEPEDNIIRRITKEQQEALLFLLNKRTNGKSASTQFCKIKGLQHRTVNAVYIRSLHSLSTAAQESNIPPSSQEINLSPSTTAVSSQDISRSRSRQAINSWSDKEDEIVRKLTEEERKALGYLKRSTKGETLQKLCSINGLEHRTVGAVYNRFYELLPPAGPNNEFTNQELEKVYQLTTEERKELIALRNSKRRTLCSFPGLQSRTVHSVLAKWYTIHSVKKWTDEEVNVVRHLTEKQLDKLEEKENKNGAALAMEMCDIDGLHRQTFGSVTYRAQKELKQGRLENYRETFPAKVLPQEIYGKQDQLQNEHKTSLAKDLQSSVYRARPWTPEEDGILLELTKRQRTTLLSYKVIARNERSRFPGLERRTRRAVETRLRAIEKAASVWGNSIDALQISYWRHEHTWTFAELSTLTALSKEQKTRIRTSDQSLPGVLSPMPGLQHIPINIVRNKLRSVIGTSKHTLPYLNLDNGLTITYRLP